MPVGRPSIYNEETVPKVMEYLERTLAEGKEIPTIEALAIHLNIRRSTVYEWIETYPEFSDILERVMSNQGNILIQGGLRGGFNSTIAKMLLTKHGYVEKTETDITTKGKALNDLKTLSDAELIAIAAGSTSGTSKEGAGEEKAS